MVLSILTMMAVYLSRFYSQIYVGGKDFNVLGFSLDFSFLDLSIRFVLPVLLASVNY